MTNLRNKIMEHYENSDKYQFPYEDFMMFLSGVIKERGIMAWTYDPKAIDTGSVLKIHTKSSRKSKKEIEDKLIVDESLGWTEDLVFDACHNFIVELSDKNRINVFLNKARSIENEKDFLNFLGTRFYWHLIKKNQSSDTGKVYNYCSKILKNSDEFIIVRTSKEKDLNIWGLSSWNKTCSVMEKHEIETFIQEFPTHHHLKKRQNPKAKKASPVIPNKDLKKVLVKIFKQAEKCFRFEDLFIIVKQSLNLKEVRTKSIYRPIGISTHKETSIDSKSWDKEPGDRKFVYIKDKNHEENENDPILLVENESAKEKVDDFIDNLNHKDRIILYNFLVLDKGHKQIADENGWVNSTVHYRLKKINKKIEYLGEGDYEHTKMIIALITINLSKNDY